MSQEQQEQQEEQEKRKKPRTKRGPLTEEEKAEKLASLKEEEARARAKLQKLVKQREKLTDEGNLKRNRSHALILLGLALVAHLKNQLTKVVDPYAKRAKETTDKGAKAEIEQNCKAKAAQITESFFTSFIDPYIDSLKANAGKIKSESRRAKQLEQADNNEKLLMLAVKAITNGKFK